MQRALTTAPRPILWVLLAALLLAASGIVCAADPLRGGSRPAQVGDTPQQIVREFSTGQLSTFDPASPTQFVASSRGAWIVLAPQPPYDNRDRVLSIYPPPWGTITPYSASGRPLAPLSVVTTAQDVPAHGRLAWHVPVDQAGSVPLLLKLEPATNRSTPMRFALESMPAYLHSDAAWLVLATACFAIMLAMVLIALCFALMLRDMAQAWYAGYILSYALILGTKSGYVFHPLGWQWLAPSAELMHASAVALSIAFAALFIVRFCQLERFAPLLRIPMLALAGGMIQLMLLRASHVTPLVDIASVLLTPLLMLGAFLLLVTSIAAGIRGSRAAWYFLAGWVPLVLLTMAGNMQLEGSLAAWTWLHEAGLIVGAFEAIVLSIGLSDRVLGLRQDRDQVRALADHDALTGAYNRRAWSERAAATLARSPGQALALLFLDLDYFKALNDRLGHHAGDQALMAVAQVLGAELRPQDLLGRYGGEEFVVLLEADTLARALEVATRLCRRVHRLELPGRDDKSILTISIGVAMHTPEQTLEALVDCADQAMYAAKLNGRNRVCIHQPRSVREPARRVLDRRGVTP